MSASPWWERSDRLQREEAALRAAGLPFRRDEAAFARGVAALDVTVEGPAGPVEVRATYPDSYPYFKPFVSAANVGFGHHWNPVSTELCLLTAEDWQPESDTLAGLLTEQWPQLVSAATGDGRGGAGELL